MKLSREIFLGRFEVEESCLRKIEEIIRVETTFSALTVLSILTRSTSTNRDHASSN